MAVEVSLFPVPENVSAYSVQEDAVGITPGDESAGTGSVRVDGAAFQDDILLSGKTVTLSDTLRGSVSGRVSAVDSGPSGMSLTAYNILGKFDVTRTLAPQNTTFGAAFAYWCTSVGIGAPTMSGPIAARAVVYPGWYGNVWEMLKNVLVVEQLELYVVGTTVGVREIRSQTVDISNATDIRESVTDAGIAKYVDVTYYNNTYVTNKEVFPLDGVEASIYQVDAKEVLEFDLQLGSSLLSVNQPTCVDWVEADPHYYDSTNGVYTVAGNDNLPYLAAQWNAKGGSLSVTLTSDPSVIHVKIVGPSDTLYAPYRIAMTSTAFYPALRITGTGVYSTPKTVRIATGADPILAVEELGETVENIFVSTLGQAINLGGRTAALYTGVSQTVAIETGDIDQDFGSTPGSRVILDGVNFRVASTMYTPSSVSLDATADTVLADLTNTWGSGTTLGVLQVAWSGKTLKDWTLRPLRTA